MVTFSEGGVSLAGCSETGVKAFEPQVGRHSRLFSVNFGSINQKKKMRLLWGGFG